MKKYSQLREFKPDELFLDEAEARLVLKFIFSPANHGLINDLPMTDALRGFSQALLLEAIDASYSVGFVKALFESSANPTKGAMKVIKKFARQSLKHWYKNASVIDLQNVKIYDFVRDELALRFRFKLYDFLADRNTRPAAGAFVMYSKPERGITKRWV